MKTIRLNTTEDDIRQAGAIIRSGGLVAFPTETVYGLGANALDAEAVASVYKAKGRPSDNPMIVHIAKLSDLSDLIEGRLDAQELIRAFWPGPLTLIFRKDTRVPDVTTGGLDTVAVRMPSNETARSLIVAAGCPIAAPSANLSGRPSPTTAEDVLEDMDGRIDAVIMGEQCDVGIESTVLDLTGDVPAILRPGIITPEMLAAVLGSEVVYDKHLLKDMVEEAAVGTEENTDGDTARVASSEEAEENKADRQLLPAFSSPETAAIAITEKNAEKDDSRVKASVCHFDGMETAGENAEELSEKGDSCVMASVCDSVGTVAAGESVGKLSLGGDSCVMASVCSPAETEIAESSATETMEAAKAADAAAEDFAPKSPGMKYKHYSPKAKVRLIEGSTEEFSQKAKVLGLDARKDGLKAAVLDYGDDARKAAHRLFADLRELDRRGYDIIFIHTLERSGLGFSVMNRMLRSAGYDVVK